MSSSSNRDLQRYFKFFTQKAVQIVVQSRQGQLFRTPSKPSAAGQDWFYLFIDDDIDLSISVKEALHRSPLKMGRAPFSIEISTKSPAEGISCVLEQWSITMTEKSLPSSVSPDSVYLKLGLLLRSLIAISRALPAYYLSKSQQGDLTMSYRILPDGIPKEEQLGSEKHIKHLTIGSVASPLGCCSVRVDYTKELTFSPRVEPISVNLNQKTESFDETDNLHPPSPLQPIPLESNVDVVLPFCATSKKLSRHLSIESQSLCEDLPFSLLLQKGRDNSKKNQIEEEEDISVSSTSAKLKSTVEASVIDDFELLNLGQIETPFASCGDKALLNFYRSLQVTAALPFCQEKKSKIISKEELKSELAHYKVEAERIKNFIETL